MIKALVICLLLNFISIMVWSQDSFDRASLEDASAQYVARFALQTVKSKNFKDLAENLFSNPFDRKDVLVFLKKHSLLKRSLPDVDADGARITIRERKRNTTLDLSQLHQMKLIFNKQQLVFTGQEGFSEIYLKLTQIHNSQKASHHHFYLLEEAHADLPVLATVALASYAKASMMAQLHDQACPQNLSVCETQARMLQKNFKNLSLKACKSQTGHLAFAADEVFNGRLRTLQYDLELAPQSEPNHVTGIQVSAEQIRCEFNLGEGDFGTTYVSRCFDVKTHLDPKNLKTQDFKMVTNKKYADLINCCSHEACSKFLNTPPARVQPLAGKKVDGKVSKK